MAANGFFVLWILGVCIALTSPRETASSPSLSKSGDLAYESFSLNNSVQLKKSPRGIHVNSKPSQTATGRTTPSRLKPVEPLLFELVQGGTEMTTRNRFKVVSSQRRAQRKSSTCRQLSRGFQPLEQRILLAVEENLVEMFARKDRQDTAIWGAEYLEDPTTFQWQPETFMYHDVTTGHEVWKLSNTPGFTTEYHNDIGVSPWNADGSKMAITGWYRFTQAYSQAAQVDRPYIWMTVDTNGNQMRPAVEAARKVGRNYFHWSPQEPQVYYEVGMPYLGSDGSSSLLYRSTVSADGTISKEPILVLPTGAIGSEISKLISADGRKIILRKDAQLYPITLASDGSASLDLPGTGGYSADRDWGLYGDMVEDPADHYHDAYVSGLGDWLFVLVSGTAVWWRIETTGSALDGGPLYTGDDGSHNFGETWPENHGMLLDGNLRIPWKAPTSNYDPDLCGYWSHFVPDRWGKYALFSNVSDNLPGSWQGDVTQNYGPGVWDIQNHEYVVPTFGGGAQHHDWHGFTDYVVSSGAPYPLGYLDQRIYNAKYDDADSQETVCFTHTRYDGGTNYNTLARPAQSPDGTKVAWHSEFLNGTNTVDVFWSVAYYPYPPTDIEAANTDGGVALGFLPPKYTERRWIDPATGLIDEVNGEVLYAREIKEYQVWRSASSTGGWDVVGTVAAEYGNDPVTNTLKPTANGDWVSETNKITFEDTPGNGTWYYALTSTEHSGLESDELSEVIEVVVSGGQVTSTRIVQAKGQTDFWTTPPQAPSNFVVTDQAVPGHYRLNWNELGGEKVRYYNVYYAAAGNPIADQSQRIASLTVGNNTYLDWLADPDVPGYYGITAVDRYGNESLITCVGGGENIPPVATADGPVATELDVAVAINVLANDSDADGTLDAGTVAIVVGPGNGDVVVNGDGTVTYTPNTGFVGTDTFRYTVQDNEGATSNEATVTISVSWINDAPVAGDDGPVSTDEDMPITINVLANDSDTDGTIDPGTVSVVVDPANGSVLVNGDGSVTYTPGANFFGTDTFSYTVQDDEGATSNQATVTVTVDTVNDAPVAAADAYSVNAGETLDVDSSGQPETATLVAAGSVWKYLDDGSNQGTVWRGPGFDDSSWSQGVAQLGYGDGDEATVVSFGPDPSNKYVTTYFRHAFLIEDPSRVSELTVELVRDDGAAVYLNGVEIVRDNLAPGAAYNDFASGYGHDSQFFQFTVDPSLLIDGQNVLAVEVHQADAGSSDISFDLRLTGTVAVTAGLLANDSDVEGEPLTALLVAGPANGNLTLDPDGTFTYTPNAGFVGTDTFTYRADDGTDLSAPATVTISVVSTGNNPPVAADDGPVSTDEGTPITINVLANDSDPDGTLDPTTVAIAAGPGNGSVVVNGDGRVTYTPTPSFVGTDTFRYTVRDNEGAVSNEATVTITVNGVNEAPVAGDDGPVSTDEGVAITISVLANDSDSDGTLDPTTVAIAAGPGNGSVLVNGDGTVTYTPNTSFVGSDTFRYTVQDNEGATSNEATVTITVNGVNEAPVAGDDGPVSTDEGIAITISVLANDSDSDGTLDPATVAIAAGPGNGSVVVNGDGTVTYTPNTSFVGSDTFRYTVQDNEGATSNEATVTIVVNGANVAPVAGDDGPVSADEDTPIAINVLLNDSDTDGTLDPGTVAIVAGPGNGSVVVNGDGTVTYTPNAGFLGPDTFRYSVRDDDGAISNEATVTVNVADPLGTVNYVKLRNLAPASGDIWYSGQAKRTGYLTVEALFVGSGSAVEVTLYDESFSVLAISETAAGGERIDWQATANETFHVSLTGTLDDVDLYLCNLVSRTKSVPLGSSGDNVIVYGTDGDDVFDFAAGVEHEVTINGIHYAFDSGSVASVQFTGEIGEDTATLACSAGSDRAWVYPNSAVLAGVDYQAEVANVANIIVTGTDGDDVACLYDSAGDDTFAATVEYGELSGDGFYGKAQGFGWVLGYAKAGGNDTAMLYDSSGDDQFQGTPEVSWLSGDGFFSRAKYFENVIAYSSGGNDAAVLFDSETNDVFEGWPQLASMSGDGYLNEVDSFASVTAYSSEGGDYALLHDSAGDDTFLATPEKGHLLGPGYSLSVYDFDWVHAYAENGGVDMAQLYDSTGDDTLVATPTFVKLRGPGFYNRANFFEYAHGYARNGGFDEAHMVDSAGDDTFFATPIYSALYNDGPFNGFYNRAKYFDKVNAYATDGGNDVAYLHGSDGADTFIGTDTYAKLYGDTFYYRAKYFETVYGDAAGGEGDQALLYDSAGSDYLEAVDNRARLAYAQAALEALDFGWVRATSEAGGKDTKRVGDIVFMLEALGAWADIG